MCCVSVPVAGRVCVNVRRLRGLVSFGWARLLRCVSVSCQSAVRLRWACTILIGFNSTIFRFLLDHY